MAALLSDRHLVIGIASSALFDLAEGQALFEKQGVKAYEEYQEKYIAKPLKPGVAFPFISRLLAFNEIVPKGVEVIVLSKNSPKTGMRVMKSIEHHNLPITRSVFRSGLSPFDFIPVFNMSLFLSANADDVKNAVASSFPAGCVLPCETAPKDLSKDLRIAFDFDGVLADDSAEKMYQENKESNPQGALFKYQEHEAKHANEPLGPGPLKNLLEGLNKLQQAEREQVEHGNDTQRRLRVSLVTARNAPAHERALHTLESWGLTVDDAFFLGGLDKIPVLNILKPHIYFDDQYGNLDSSERNTPTVHIPFGATNPT